MKEREWLKHQTFGELDDSKLVDGMTGERNVYKRRGEADPPPGAPQPKPTKLDFVFDVSGSMYRFNGEVGRSYEHYLHFQSLTPTARMHDSIAWWKWQLWSWRDSKASSTGE